MARLSVVVLLMARLAFGTDPCDCSVGTWSYKGADYEGCSETADWKDHHWCYVEDGETCITATASSMEGETRKYQECSPCDCMTDWDYLGGDYHGCAETSDWAGVDWCYVRGPASCASATASTIEGETRKYRQCAPCNCLNTWTYQNTVQDGCSETADWADTDWCYVQGRSNCLSASASSVAGENKWYQQCSPCNCMQNWNYQGDLYDGCAETRDWAGKDWCYVQGGSQCITASPSSVDGEDRSYRECSACNCFTQWNYQGAVYEGCAETDDWAGTDWCYVQGGSNCNTASPSSVAGEDRRYRQCSACNCLTQWNYQGAVYEGCAETPDWAGHDWCYVQGGSNCASAVAESLVAGEDKMYIECSPCTCLSNWNYLGAMYDGCAETPDWDGVNWCYVQGGSNCASALQSSVEGEDRWYIKCTDEPPAPPVNRCVSKTKKWSDKKCMKKCDERGTNTCNFYCFKYCTDTCACNADADCKDDPDWFVTKPMKNRGKKCKFVTKIETTGNDLKKTCRAVKGKSGKNLKRQKVKAWDACRETCGRCRRRLDALV